MQINIDAQETIRHLILMFSALSSSFIITLLSIPFFIKLVKRLKMGKQIREEASLGGGKAGLFQELHKDKGGTPTMAGILIWGVTVFIIFLTFVLASEPISLFNNSLWNRQETYLPVFTLITVGLLGWVDDYINITSSSKGLKSNYKMLWLILLSVIGGMWFHYKLGYSHLNIPGLGNFEIGQWYIPLFVLVFISTANSVNITDGLDGLAGGLLIIAFGTFSAIAYIHGLYILTTLCCVIVGALLAFLWFNIPPALFFMGDTGSLSLGATLGVVALMTDSVVPLIFIGSIFVIETLSVIIQWTSKRFLGRKVFHIAPIHHHFEYIGWKEHTVTMRFWIIGGFGALVGLLISLITQII